MNKKIFIFSVLALIIDQISKVLISSFFSLNENFTVIKNFFNINYVKNYGAAWSIFSYKIEFLSIASIIALLIIYRYMYNFKQNMRNNIAFGLLLGGIVGNLLDRLFLGCVRDFLSFKIFNYYYPVFNFADTFIVIGVFLLIISVIKGDDKKRENSSRK